MRWERDKEPFVLLLGSIGLASATVTWDPDHAEPTGLNQTRFNETRSRIPRSPGNGNIAGNLFRSLLRQQPKQGKGGSQPRNGRENARVRVCVQRR